MVNAAIAGAEYQYHKIYFMTELLMLIHFLFLHYMVGFSEIFIINSGFVIAGVIWSVIFYVTGENKHKLLVAMLFFAAIRRVFLDDSIYPLIYSGVGAFIMAVILRHLYYLVIGDFKVSLDYLEYKPEDRFDADSFIIVKLIVIFAIGFATIKSTLFCFIIFLPVMLIFKLLRRSLAIIVNIMILLAVSNGILW